METRTEPRSLTANTLFPVFLRLEELNVLMVGSDHVAIEKIKLILEHTPEAHIRVVSPNISPALMVIAMDHPGVQWFEREYTQEDLRSASLIVVAVANRENAAAIREEAKQLGRLVYVPGEPQQSDFRLEPVLSKGNLKIAISTNGKSPVIARRLIEVFSDALPDQVDSLLDNMQRINSRLNGNLSSRIRKLNQMTSVLLQRDEGSFLSERTWRRIATYSLFAFLFMFLGHLVSNYFPLADFVEGTKRLAADIDSRFYWMVAAGFAAQLVDGALGMGYGLTCTTILLSLGINLPAISGSIHTAEMFSSGISGYSHYKFGNVNKKLFQKLLIPGVVGAVAGAYLLSTFGDEHSNYIRPALAAYTLFLGAKILTSVFRKSNEPGKVKRVGWLAGAGGFLDSATGGGWGPLVTSSLISKGRSPKYVIGSVSLTEFFITLASALTFFSLLGISHWPVILGLIVGGSLAAPLAARLAGKLPVKVMFVAVGSMVVLWSLRLLVGMIF